MGSEKAPERAVTHAEQSYAINVRPNPPFRAFGIDAGAEQTKEVN